MGGIIVHRCPGCGGPLNRPHRLGYGAKCRTDGCPVQKVHHDEAGNIVWILYSTEPVGAPVAPDQLRVMEMVNLS